jgi:hypothetical protein
VLVQLFLAFACGSEETLGFDTTIKCVKPPKQREDDEHAAADPNNAEENPIASRLRPRLATQKRKQMEGSDADLRKLPPSRVYEFTVPVSESEGAKNGSVRTFRTIRCLADYGAVRIRSRGTLVFEVTDVKIPGSVYVLKDVWIDKDRTLEGDTLLDIRERLGKENPEALQHFLDRR